MESRYTQIQVKLTTRKALKSLKLVDRESYDSVINRLIKDIILNKLNKDEHRTSAI